MLRRPALRRAVLGTGTEDRDRPVRRQRESPHRGSGIRSIGHKHRSRRRRDQPAVRHGKRDKAIDQTGKRLAIEAARFGQERPATFARVADAAGNAREPRNQRRLERIGQNECARVRARPDLARERAPAPETELTVAERILDHAADAAHARVYRRAPRRREHIDDRLAQRLTQDRNQRLGQNGVADPGRRDDQDTFGHDEKLDAPAAAGTFAQTR